jgi:hypothetical protein
VGAIGSSGKDVAIVASSWNLLTHMHVRAAILPSVKLLVFAMTAESGGTESLATAAGPIDDWPGRQ